jgi:putative pyruvate formate lyase activating enzyme
MDSNFSSAGGSTSKVEIREGTIPKGRQEIARERAAIARRALEHCCLCAHRCGANRFEAHDGLCHSGAVARVFSVQVEVSDELELIPTFAIALSGCDLRCAFCVTGEQSWNSAAGMPIDLKRIAGQAEQAIEQGARSIMILGGEPTIHLPAVMEIVSALPNRARLVWKTNAYGSEEARDLLSGLFDVWVPDYKFGNDACALRLARIPNYTSVVRENLRWASREADLIVRHLLMPGHIECCWGSVARWIASELPDVKVNLRAGFWPGWQSSRHPELCAPLTKAESDQAWGIARELQLNLVE